MDWRYITAMVLDESRSQNKSTLSTIMTFPLPSRSLTSLSSTSLTCNTFFFPSCFPLSTSNINFFLPRFVLFLSFLYLYCFLLCFCFASAFLLCFGFCFTSAFVLLLLFALLYFASTFLLCFAMYFLLCFAYMFALLLLLLLALTFVLILVFTLLLLLSPEIFFF
jgi:hypothetical protein